MDEKDIIAMTDKEYQEYLKTIDPDTRGVTKAWKGCRIPNEY